MMGSAKAPVIMGPPQSSAGCIPKVTDYCRLTLDEDQRTAALVGSLREELVALHQCIDNQEHSASPAEMDKATDVVFDFLSQTHSLAFSS